MKSSTNTTLAIPSLYHGTSVGWLGMPYVDSQGRNRTHGFKFNAGHYGETTDGIDVIWLTEDKHYAERMAFNAHDKVLKRNYLELFKGMPIPKPGKMVYEVVLSHPDLVVLDLSATVISDEMLRRISEGVKRFHRAVKTPQLKKLELAFGSLNRYASKSSGWFEWLTINLGIASGWGEERASNSKRFRHLSAFCKLAGIDVIINPLTMLDDNRVLHVTTDGNKPDWMLFNLAKPDLKKPAQTLWRTYKIVNAYGVMPEFPPTKYTLNWGV